MFVLNGHLTARTVYDSQEGFPRGERLIMALQSGKKAGVRGGGLKTGLKHLIRISVFGKLTKMLTCSMTNTVQMSALLHD